MKNIQLVDNFIGLYPVSKTLCFELRPMGRTQEYMERDGVLNTDFHRAESYKKVKKIIDRYHKQFIEKALASLQLDGLEEYEKLYILSKRNDKQEKEFDRIQKTMRQQIVNCFKSHPLYKTLFKKELIKKELIEFTKNNQTEQQLVQEFSDFSTYFSGFFENRKNMYSSEAKSTAIAYRIIHQNLPKYIDNMRIFKSVQTTPISEHLNGLLKCLQRKVEISSLEEYFEIHGFNLTLTQCGIDIYNTILGAYVGEDKVKAQGLNEYINLYNQKKDRKQKIPKMKPLFKQILSDKEKVSFIPEQFESDQEVLDAIVDMWEKLQRTVFDEKQQLTVTQLFQNMSHYRLGGIFVKNDGSINSLSQHVFGDWSAMSTAISEIYDRQQTGKKINTIKYANNKKKDLQKIKNYSIEKLNNIASEYRNEQCHIEIWFEEEINNVIKKVEQSYRESANLIEQPYQEKKALYENDKAIALIKNLLDSIKELQWFLKPLIGGQMEPGKDELFYTELLRIWESLDIVTLLYNRVRNYVTKKPYSTEKVKLNFDCSTLLKGWDKNKERNNLGVVLMKDDLYYLGILNRNCRKVIEQAPQAETGNVYQKMEYKLLPGPNKMLPKVFFSKSRIGEFAPSLKVCEHYKRGTFKKGENFNLEACHELIDFFKDSINKHEDWSQFKFSFSDTSTYEDISGFYREVEHQGYKIMFRNIDQSYIDELVENGQLYLFQIYNKDFSPYSKGNKNLHTLYWNMLFSSDNLDNVVYKLNGEAEIFYRKASIRPEDAIYHYANEPIKNKDVHTEKATSTFAYDLIKDKRFTVDKYQFHVPITMNFQALGEDNINQKLNCLLHDTEDVHVIGIDRGERNLLYLTVVDSRGNIKEQMSLNDIISYDKENREHKKDYHMLLDEREKMNKSARQNWQTVKTIKELKEGYLSQVIHVITGLMVKYNAIVALEDLNFGFLRGRQKVEKQVYQKFEKMLIDKLNYLVDKNKEPQENGGLLHAYQLTNRFESFQKLGKQSGFLYYVPAWNTSKIDPTTGFVNLFYTKYESVEKTKEFIKKLDSISYNVEKDYFEFTFDYSKYTYKAEGSRLNWTICSNGRRIENYRNPEKNNEWDTREVFLTKEWKKLFEQYQISWENMDMRKGILAIEQAEFYRRFMRLFTLVLQMRNSNSKTGEDSMISPVVNGHGEFFESGSKSYLPIDADANGAYNVARKGLWIVDQIQKTDVNKLGNLKLTISNKEWLKYAQEHTL